MDAAARESGGRVAFMGTAVPGSPWWGAAVVPCPLLDAGADRARSESGDGFINSAL
eukprot:gene11928-1800_t